MIDKFKFIGKQIGLIPFKDVCGREGFALRDNPLSTYFNNVIELSLQDDLKTMLMTEETEWGWKVNFDLPVVFESHSIGYTHLHE